MGKLFFELNKDQPPELYAELFSKLAALDEKIESMREELNAAKAAIESQTEPGVQVEIVEELPDVLPEAPADGE